MTIKGESGQDVLLSAAENNLLMGGEGNDVFEFAASSVHDHIKDFSEGDLVKIFLRNEFDEAQFFLKKIDSSGEKLR